MINATLIFSTMNEMTKKNELKQSLQQAAAEYADALGVAFDAVILVEKQSIVHRVIAAPNPAAKNNIEENSNV